MDKEEIEVFLYMKECYISAMKTLELEEDTEKELLNVFSNDLKKSLEAKKTLAY